MVKLVFLLLIELWPRCICGCIDCALTLIHDLSISQRIGSGIFMIMALKHKIDTIFIKYLDPFFNLVIGIAPVSRSMHRYDRPLLI
ncbi:hypothetical protein D1872_273160 [compost metagenome]